MTTLVQPSFFALAITPDLHSRGITRLHELIAEKSPAAARSVMLPEASRLSGLQ